MTDEGEISSGSKSYSSYSTPSSEQALKYRLDTAELLDQIEMFLRAERPTIQEGRVVKMQMGKALANDAGIQNILQTITLTINRHTMQGNLEDTEVNLIVQDIQRDLAFQLSLKTEEWDIDRDSRRFIVRNITRLAKMVISRTKDNLERESYNMAVQQRDTTEVIPKKSGLGIFKK